MGFRRGLGLPNGIALWQAAMDLSLSEAKRMATIGFIMAFFTITLHIVSRNARMFTKKYARRHRLTGLLMLMWLFAGFGLVFSGNFTQGDSTVCVWVVYDVMLGILGTATAYTAAMDFKVAHSERHIKNKASGVLDEEATVTYSEMLEHTFYQGLNLVQVLYLHIMAMDSFDQKHFKGSTNIEEQQQFVQFLISDQLLGTPRAVGKIVCGMLVTAPWLLRSHFPVNKFQANYTKGQDPWTLTSLMYRVKKYQYVFYKHVMLHGLNASLALPYLAETMYLSSSNAFPYLFHEHSLSYEGAPEGSEDERAVHLVNSDVFRLYWLCLNLSYVMEFFLQTLVKRHYMSQKTMMVLQRLLMSAATLTALSVVPFVHPVCAVLSFLFMFIRRKQEMSNFACVLIGATLYTFSYHYNRRVHEVLLYLGLPLLAATAVARAYAHDRGLAKTSEKKRK